MKHDIVYILKNDYEEEELRYSLRSVCLNFPYRKIVFVGGCPGDIKPDIYLSHVQIGATKWERSQSSLIKALSCDGLTDDVWLFNDDFFIMDKIKAHEDKNYFNGTLEKRVIDLKRNCGKVSGYVNQLDRLRHLLLNANRDTLSFTLHLPMLINRKKALELLTDKKFNTPMFRSLYGNYYKIPCEFMEDVKVRDLEQIPDTPYISTTDEAFRDGKVGEFLRRYFADPCKYERSHSNVFSLKEIYTEEGEVRYE
ncbi:MAG: hypothetical protein IIY21_20690 [Clostridiales bacterium]|nr:hypothetical protein [Clostridiales bacterium]